MDFRGFAFEKPKDKKKWTKQEAFEILPDGREICTKSTAGREEYKRRIKLMWLRQGKVCCICGRTLALGAATFEHRDRNGNPKGRGGMWTDERIEVDGVPQNGAAHGWCNALRGSRNAVKVVAMILFTAVLAWPQTKNQLELKTGARILLNQNLSAWSSEGNGGGDFSGWTLIQERACLYGPVKFVSPSNPDVFFEMASDGQLCILGAHGRIYFGSFGTGVFVYDDEGYIYPVMSWASTSVREFSNGVH